MNNTLILILVVGTALAFDFTNGFHDTANSVAPTIATGALKPRTAVAFSAALNIVGAFLSLKVAATIASSIVDQTSVTLAIVFAGLAGAIAWNITTWFFGLPSSSSHALIGGVVGAMFASVGSAGVLWHGIAAKVFVPGIIAPLVALLVAGLATIVSRVATSRVDDGARTIGMRVGQIGASGLQSIAHGTNDAQKTMGVITLALVANGTLAADAAVPTWVIWTCAIAMALGTFIGGWRIIRTMGHGLTHIDPTQGFAAQMSSSVVLLTSSHLGLPLSTTYVATGSVVGTGIATRGRKVHWNVAGRVVAAWLITLPAAGLVGAAMFGVESLFSGSVGEVVVAILLVGYASAIFLRSRRQVVDHTNVNEPWKSELDEPVATAVAA
ncbi:MAG: inorganic phosphate transporter family protein [Acidobacteria bacterium]|nr:inorganic phosphate transporter family protein [Acidobacteriota bacterium]